MPSSTDKRPPKPLDARMVAAICCVLAAGVPLILAVGPGSRLSAPGMAHLVPVLYLTYTIPSYAAACWWHSSLAGDRCSEPVAATGIQVQGGVDGALLINDALAAEVFHIISEGLSNIRRHTQATTARIALVREMGHLHTQIRNDGAEVEVFERFTPRTITERTVALGGEVRIERQIPAHTAVIAEILL
jgi:hypothetical protein